MEQRVWDPTPGVVRIYNDLHLANENDGKSGGFGVTNGQLAVTS